MKSKIIGLFPKAVYVSELDREFTSKELFFVNETKLNSRKLEGNISSNDTYILNNEIFKEIKMELELRIKDYFNKIICPVDNFKPYITQSWLNYTEINQFHHKHNHSNSIVSGVLYINSDEKFDSIKFFKTEYEQILPQVKEWNCWNANSTEIKVKSGYIILFPSSLIHMVENKKGTNSRISLAFNVFVKGELGEQYTLNKLVL
jgi:uncharacterized protein (TIGR02466 family)